MGQCENFCQEGSLTSSGIEWIAGNRKESKSGTLSCLLIRVVTGNSPFKWKKSNLKRKNWFGGIA